MLCAQHIELVSDVQLIITQLTCIWFATLRLINCKPKSRAGITFGFDDGSITQPNSPAEMTFGFDDGCVSQQQHIKTIVFNKGPMIDYMNLKAVYVAPPPPPRQEYVAYSHTGRIIPAIWFRYDLSPITVKYTERRQPLYRFITTVSYISCGSSRSNNATISQIDIHVFDDHL